MWYARKCFLPSIMWEVAVISCCSDWLIKHHVYNLFANGPEWINWWNEWTNYKVNNSPTLTLPLSLTSDLKWCDVKCFIEALSMCSICSIKAEPSSLWPSRNLQCLQDLMTNNLKKVTIISIIRQTTDSYKNIIYPEELYS